MRPSVQKHNDTLRKLVVELKRLVTTGKLDSVEDAFDVLKNVFGFNDELAEYYYGRF